MLNKLLYEKYHGNIKLQKRIININDFTYKNILSRITKYIPSKGYILDIGSATGTLSFLFASKGLGVDGVELSKNAVEYANLNKDSFGLDNINFINTSIEKFKTNKRYAMITCFEVLEHLRDDKSNLAKIKGWMDSNSILAISVPSSNAPLYKMGLLRTFDKDVGHLRRYSMLEIKNLLSQAGLKILKAYKTEGIIRNILFTNKKLGFFVKFTRFKVLNKIVSVLDEMSVKVFGESQLILISKKK